MTRPSNRPSIRLRAAAAAVLLLLTGALIGIAVDRTILSPADVEARSPLTARAMASSLGLSPAEQAGLEALLDSLHAEVVAAADDGPDALRAATASAHRRIETWLPPASRPAFRQWIQGHREHMMERMHGGPMEGRRMDNRR